MKNKKITKNIGCGLLYFYIHFVTEVICFYFLSSIIKVPDILWLIPIIYDGLAFVPQSIIGVFNDKYPKLNISILGLILLVLGLIFYGYTTINIYVILLLICLGNACIHIRGAEITLKNCNGNLSHSAIFVAGGSFGVVTGKLLSKIIPVWIIILLGLITIPFILLAETYKNSKEDIELKDFNYANENMNPTLVIYLCIIVVIIRGYMGYGIPTSWNKTTLELIIFYFTMGLGKALGGILSDKFGIRKISLFSTLLSIPFLCIGDNIMLVSLIGVMLFSMTMPITLGILVSILKKYPGFAFGLTTIGLFLGTLPIFFINITSKLLNILLIITTSLLCSIILYKILGKDENEIHIQNKSYNK